MPAFFFETLLIKFSMLISDQLVPILWQVACCWAYPWHIQLFHMHSDHLLARTNEPAGLNLPNDLLRNISRYFTKAFVTPSAKRSMSTASQRNNLFLLADQVLAFDVPGDLVECGCHDGGTALAIAMANDQHGSKRAFHVYDDFKFDPKGTDLVKSDLILAFNNKELPLPEIHEGDIVASLVTDLPEKISFAHIDLGFEEEPRQVMYMVNRCLEAIYPRMSAGAICVLMDYHDNVRTVNGWDCNPGVKMACDRFLVDKPEQINVLFGEEYSHAFFRKADQT